jgi:uncharacterized repeat protein (TIGR01451 family)
VTCTFSYTGASQSFVVPSSGVSALTIDAWGAQGSGGSGAASGALGGSASAQFAVGPSAAVTPGETLDVFVGGAGSTADPSNSVGAFNGGGVGADAGTQAFGPFAGATVFAGDGGGASDVRTSASDLNTRLIVAGGGGGGGDAGSGGPSGGPGGTGGQSGAPGTGGDNLSASVTGGGGGGAGGSAGGAGGTAGADSGACGIVQPGSAGMSGVGGAGSRPLFCGGGSNGGFAPGPGGGGGGGYFGGGGGGTGGAACQTSASSVTCTGAAGGGGGGGGSSFVNGAGSNVAFHTGVAAPPPATSGNGLVLISYTVPVQAPTLTISKTGPSSVDAGEAVSWTLSVGNTGPGGSSGYTVSDLVPSGVTSLSTSSSGCSISGSQLTCNEGALAQGATAPPITVSGKAPVTASGTTLLNSASVQGNDPGSQSVTSQQVSTTVAPAPEPSITKSGPATVNAGETITWKIDVANMGAGESRGYTVSDTLPSGVANLATSSSGCSIVGSQLSCTEGGLAPGAGAPSITVTGTAPSSSTTLTNQATLTPQGQSAVTSNTVSTAVLAQAATSVTAGASSYSGDFNDGTTVSGTLTDSSSGGGVAGATLTFQLNNAEQCSGTTSSSGVASCSLTPSDTPSANAYTLRISYAGDSTHQASAANMPFTVTKEQSALSYTGPVAFANGKPATLSAQLTEDGDTAKPLSGQSVTLTLGSGGGAQSCTATTDARGSASCTIASVNQPENTGFTVPVSASFGGDTFYSPSSASKTGGLSVQTSITPGASSYSGDFNDGTTVSATLSDSSTGTGISGVTVSFKLNDVESCSATTDGSGVASCALTPGETPSTTAYTLHIAYAGDTNRQAGSVDVPFAVTKEQSALAYTGSLGFANSKPATLSAQLTEDGDTAKPLSGRSVTLTLGSGGSSQSCTATSDASGNASCTISSVNQPSSGGAGVPVTASFAGDGFYSSSSASQAGSVSLETSLTPGASSYSGDFNDGTTVSATVKDSSSGSGIAGVTLTFELNAIEQCSGTTDASGVASCSLTPGDRPSTGAYTLHIWFAGDANHQPSSGDVPFTVTKEQSAVAYTGATTADFSDQVTASATLTDPVDHTPIAGEALVLTLNNSESCQATTDATGSASCQLTPGEQAGGYTLSVSFAGDAFYQGANAGTQFTVTTEEASLAYTGASTGDFNDQFTASATLTTDQAPLAGETVTLTLDNGESCHGTTNATGGISCPLTPGEAPGSYPLSVSFAGDGFYRAASAQVQYNVSQEEARLLYKGATTADFNDQFIASATVTDPADQTPIAGKTVVFTLNSNESCQAKTDATGFASCPLTTGEDPGTYQLSVSFGDSSYVTASAGAQITVTQEEAQVAYTGATSGRFNHQFIASATLTDPVDQTPIAGKPVRFQLNNAEQCSGTTNASGVVSCPLTPGEPAGSYTLAVSFASDGDYQSASTQTSFSVLPAQSQLVYTGATTSDFNDQFTASATLIDTADQKPIAGKTVVFALNNSEACQATTDATGSASCPLTPGEQAGGYTLSISFAGDAFYAGAGASTQFAVTHEQTTLSYDGPVQVANGSSATLRGTLLEDNTTPITARTVTFTLGSGASAQSCTGTTDSGGHASCTITTVRQPDSATFTLSVDDSFAGDQFYLPASATGTVDLLYYTGRGIGALVSLRGGASRAYADTGEIATAQAMQMKRTALAVSLDGLSASGLDSSVTTGGGSTTTNASTASIALSVAGVPLVKATGLSASSQSSCSTAIGSAAIGSLTVGGTRVDVANPKPNTKLTVGGLTITLNEQTPVPGADQGLTVNALHLFDPSLVDVIISSATSDIHHCT